MILECVDEQPAARLRREHGPLQPDPGSRYVHQVADLHTGQLAPSQSLIPEEENNVGVLAAAGLGQVMQLFKREHLAFASCAAALGWLHQRSDVEANSLVAHDRVTIAGLSDTEVAETLGAAGLLQLVHSLPTRQATNALRMSKHLHPPPHQKWKASDFIDVVQLPVPTVYCDVVFTEQQWVRALTRATKDRLDERYNTRLISTPEQLVEVLVAASRSTP